MKGLRSKLFGNGLNPALTARLREPKTEYGSRGATSLDLQPPPSRAPANGQRELLPLSRATASPVTFHVHASPQNSTPVQGANGSQSAVDELGITDQYNTSMATLMALFAASDLWKKTPTTTNRRALERQIQRAETVVAELNAQFANTGIDELKGFASLLEAGIALKKRELEGLEPSRTKA